MNGARKIGSDRDARAYYFHLVRAAAAAAAIDGSCRVAMTAFPAWSAVNRHRRNIQRFRWEVDATKRPRPRCWHLTIAVPPVLSAMSPKT